MKPADQSKLRFDVVEGLTGDVDAVLEMRHDTLEPRAYGYVAQYRDGTPGWTVAFRTKGDEGTGSQNGKAITMRLDGTDIHAVHVPCVLRYFHRLPHRRA